ncbi:MULTISPECIES: 5-demethoxyubiquinol-8 5-hydroxylase UbiM [Neisseria]|jgi:ubiquinone biosynthesis hydroxylase, ubiH/ubiF/visC/COQ6 family|uniref:5-demethoxyubiquinol-8 5-hydroxylase UbiM n=2 Tax=Neisseria TaxID=482 RepID=A0AA36UHU7_9NEIS|nr:MULTISPECIES: 5-demethoxyubiquinol-8 5-hydroxylase UbiM [Neisseria]RKV63854.1 MAG: FAD-dependent hydroxylase [Neisseria sp.]EET45046.1 ubiquinone biosynthesis hydroxylase, UbiH/UbiF/VisC/COQ6 family [Neisseria sicca ATCC 29256]EGQ74593.1 UbiH/UbiF/VisC/COQ6 family ubiquinone biosynthesis hydroxylase [Neisseria macacae ATCC 33926]OFN84519.1 ubiquinone biosynthesis protein UbiH [Neisseria sp. HMSC064E01]OFO31955.1 ubiquinone biosynthesis protein UbiH [Neisseria sp. HMSC065D04]
MSLHSDILVVGAGPAGLSFAAELAGSGLKITLIEKSPLEILQNPPYDGREIALTHLSREIMQRLGMWDLIPKDEIYPLRDAKVLNGQSDYQLHFPQPTQARGEPADCLGYLISNHNIRKAAYEVVSKLENVTILTGTGVKEVKTSEDEAQVILENGEVLSGRLLLAADSRFSQTRRQLGISSDMHDYSRTMFVCRMKHTLSNQHTAYECFHYGRTIALLPLEEHLTNTVITVDSDKADTIKKMSPEELAASVKEQLKGRLGDMELVSTIHNYPLVGMIAQRFYGKRSALIGDAAVGMHPVTAHGFNLGLSSADLLAKLVLEAEQRGQDIGAASLLEKYSTKHMLHAQPIYHGTNMLLKLFTNETAPAKILRGLVLRASNNFPPLKKLITKQLTG